MININGKVKVWLLGAMVFVTVLLLAAIIIQIVYVRTKLSSVQSSLYNKELQIRSQYNQEAKLSNKLQVYGLQIDNNSTRLLNNTTMSLGSTLLPIVTPKEFRLPHVCDNNSVQSLSVAVNKVGFLVVTKNLGAEELIKDIINNNVLYVIVNGHFMLIDWDNGDKMKSIIETVKQHDPVSSTIEDRYIFFVYAPKSEFNSLVERHLQPVCNISIKTFLGNTVDVVDTTDKRLVNMESVFGLSKTETFKPLHLLGYKA